MSTSPLPTTRRGWQQLISDLDLRPSKGRGQNFLHDISVVHQIVKAADVGPNDHVLEIGPGLGILTNELASRASRVTAIELDTILADHLARTFSGRESLTLVRGDVLVVDMANLLGPGPVKVVANLPYSAGAAIVQRILESELNLVSATLMLQREVAERLIAAPPDMSILSVATQTYATGEIAFLVPPDVFLPPPTVVSAVVHLVPHAKPLIGREDRTAYFGLINAGFRHKRKNIANSLEIETHRPKSELVPLLETAKIDPTRRAQTLSVEDWIRLFKVWISANA